MFPNVQEINPLTGIMWLAMRSLLGITGLRVCIGLSSNAQKWLGGHGGVTVFPAYSVKISYSRRKQRQQQIFHLVKAIL